MRKSFPLFGFNSFDISKTVFVVLKLGIFPEVITFLVELDEFLVLRFFDFKDLSLIFDGFLFVPFLGFHDLEVLIFVSFSSYLVTIAVSSLGAASE